VKVLRCANLVEAERSIQVVSIGCSWFPTSTYQRRFLRPLCLPSSTVALRFTTKALLFLRTSLFIAVGFRVAVGFEGRSFYSHRSKRNCSAIMEPIAWWWSFLSGKFPAGVFCKRDIRAREWLETRERAFDVAYPLFLQQPGQASMSRSAISTVLALGFRNGLRKPVGSVHCSKHSTLRPYVRPVLYSLRGC